MDFKHDIEIIEDNEESISEYHAMGWGGTETLITKNDLIKFMSGKLLALNDGEYTHIFKYEAGI